MLIILAAWKVISWCKAHLNMCMSKLQFIKNWSWERQGTVNSGVCLDFQICSIFFKTQKRKKWAQKSADCPLLLIWENISLLSLLVSLSNVNWHLLPLHCVAFQCTRALTLFSLHILHITLCCGLQLQCWLNVQNDLLMMFSCSH